MTWNPEHQKYLTVADLRAVLDQLQPTDELYPNRVGNLSIHRDGVSIGFLDFAEANGAVERWDDTEAPP